MSLEDQIRRQLETEASQLAHGANNIDAMLAMPDADDIHKKADAQHRVWIKTPAMVRLRRRIARSRRATGKKQ